MSGTVYDPDVFDAEIQVARFGCRRFSKEDLAGALGIAKGSVWRYVKIGKLPPPAECEDRDCGGRALWTPEQVVEILVQRSRSASCE